MTHVQKPLAANPNQSGGQLHGHDSKFVSHITLNGNCLHTRVACNECCPRHDYPSEALKSIGQLTGVLPAKMRLPDNSSI